LFLVAPSAEAHVAAAISWYRVVRARIEFAFLFATETTMWSSDA
jgi:hypothetical protein